MAVARKRNLKTLNERVGDLEKSFAGLIGEIRAIKWMMASIGIPVLVSVISILIAMMDYFLKR